jgi:hypothetical protein
LKWDVVLATPDVADLLRPYGALLKADMPSTKRGAKVGAAASVLPV